MTEAGRASVAGALETVLATCAVGRSRVVLIEGAAGCGKSHLLDAVAEQAADAGALVLTAVATEAERRVPLGVLRQLVGSAPVSALPRTGAEDATPAGEASGVPGRRAVFATLHAEALLRVGDVRGAHVHATAALEALPSGGGGTFRYAPAAVLVRACGALGRYDEAARHGRHPVTHGQRTTGPAGPARCGAVPG